jgi:hypothetical protein
MSDTTQDLRQRRQALATQLNGLREQRELASRANSYAVSRQRAGVTNHDEAVMQGHADSETAGDSAMTQLRREIEAIDEELGRDRRGALAWKALTRRKSRSQK